MNLWAAVVLITIAENGVVTYAPFYDIVACETAKNELRQRLALSKSICVPTITGNPGRHNDR